MFINKNDRKRSGVRNDVCRGINMDKTKILGSLFSISFCFPSRDFGDAGDLFFLDFDLRVEGVFVPVPEPPPLMLVIKDLVSTSKLMALEPRFRMQSLLEGTGGREDDEMVLRCASTRNSCAATAAHVINPLL